MEQYQREFIRALIDRGAFLFGDYDLVTGRSCPYYLDTGKFDDGDGLRAIGDAFAQRIQAALGTLDNHLLYGIPEKGIPLAAATAMALSERGVNIPLFYTRPPKTHGEATGADTAKPRVLGRTPDASQRLISVDNVLSSGTSAYNARKEIARLGEYEHALLAIAADRQEVLFDGTNAVDRYERTTGTPIAAIITTTDILTCLRDTGTHTRDVERIEHYLRAYGTAAARAALTPLAQRVVRGARSILPALDTRDLSLARDVVRQTTDIDDIAGYKLGFTLALEHGLSKVGHVLRELTHKPLIYDHEKAGTDTPHTGRAFAAICKDADIDTIILYPQAGQETQRAWTYHALDHGLNVLVGGWMTHPAYAASEGGNMDDGAILRIYERASQMGITNIVVPGTKPDAVRQILDVVRAQGVEPTCFAPGFGRQRGSFADTLAATGGSLHAFVGRALIDRADRDYRRGALELIAQLRA